MATKLARSAPAIAPRVLAAYTCPLDRPVSLFGRRRRRKRQWEARAPQDRGRQYHLDTSLRVEHVHDLIGVMRAGEE